MSPDRQRPRMDAAGTAPGSGDGARFSRRTFARIAASGLAVSAAAPLLAACGASGDESSADGRVTLKFWKYEDPATKTVLEQLVAKYNRENANVRVVMQTFPFDQYLAEKITTALSAGSGPDVFWVSAATLLNFAPKQLLLPLGDAFTPQEQSDFLPQSLRGITLRDEIYGVPHEMGVQGLLYDQRLMDRLRLEPPKTWDELKEVAAKIKTDTRWGIMLPTAPDVFQNFIWWPFLWMGGGEVMSPDWSRATIAEPAGVEALALWGDLVRDGLAAPKSSGAFGEELAQGKAGMAALGMWVVGNYRTTYPDVALGAAPLPTPAAGGRSLAAFGGWYTAVSAATKHSEEARRFAVWLFGEDKSNAVELTKAMTVLSPRRSVTATLETLPAFREAPIPEFTRIWPSTRSEPAYPAEIQSAVTNALQAVMFSKVEPERAAEDAAKAIDSYLASPDASLVKESMGS